MSDSLTFQRSSSRDVGHFVVILVSMMGLPNHYFSTDQIGDNLTQCVSTVLIALLILIKIDKKFL